MASTPCAACKLLRRKCTQECVFAPYFPPTNPQKFIFVHRVFGASNVTKILNDLPPDQREDTVNSLFYEAEARIRDPIYGCVGLISFLQQYLKKIQQDLLTAKEELVGYMGPDAVIPPPYLPPIGNNPPPNFMMSMEGMPPGVIPQGEPLMIREPNMSQQHHHQQPQDEQLQFIASDAQRMAAMMLERGDQQGMFNGYGIDNNGSVTATGFNQMDVNDQGAGGSLSGPSLALGSFGDAYQMGQETEHGHINHDQLQTQLMLQPPLQEGQEQTEEGQFLMQPMGQENLHDEEEEEELEAPVKWRKSENKEASF
ncbi:LOB domain-containing protein 10 [Arabidopsis thaliana]|uniref:LBD10 n=2 Tax=Arabidopsis TaxID=3701 RepID=A0A178VXQ4_ARATH|nr:Lateral organ boundaries LOB [Arabidopsis thaliana x Arabidopsis arenosa]OAP10596.1 LBD10 [Arabidopsis thaliana]